MRVLPQALLLFSVGAFAFPRFPREVKERTGLSDDDILRLISPVAATVATGQSQQKCPANNASGEVFPGPTLPSIKDLLKRNSFVKRSGTKLTLLGDDFTMTGPNIYWLGLDENALNKDGVPHLSYPSKTRVLEAFGTVSAMRGTHVRGHTLGISIGNPSSVMPSLGVYNKEAYEPIDFAILVARIYGIKLLIPLVDNYNWYHGGKYQWIQWAGIPFQGQGADITPPGVGGHFYNTTSIVKGFHEYITTHLNHVNQYTGIAYKDDPTILGWESGNELAAYRFEDGPAPPTWTREIGDLIKSLAPKHLYFDGSYGIHPGTGQLENQNVDVFSNHYYPPNIAKLTNDISLVHAAGRHYYAGEYEWKGTRGDDLASWLKVIRDSGSSDSFWSLFGRDDDCCQWVEHNDGFSFYFQRNPVYKAQGKIMAQHAVLAAGSNAPAILPAAACPQYKFPGLKGFFPLT